LRYATNFDRSRLPGVVAQARLLEALVRLDQTRDSE
jgi:hypothetical protein